MHEGKVGLLSPAEWNPLLGLSGDEPSGRFEGHVLCGFRGNAGARERRSAGCCVSRGHRGPMTDKATW